METRIESKTNFMAPPGGFVIWVFIFSELFVFGMALISFAYEKSMNLEVFEASRNQLNQLYGTINTIVLITSGFFIAQASKNHHKGNKEKTIRWLFASFSLGAAFIVLKGLEYSDKISSGLTLGHNTFFDYYWILTMFHALHVLLGLIIIAGLIITTYKDIKLAEDDFNFETGCLFWHMCDFIWVLVFPVIYLL